MRAIREIAVFVEVSDMVLAGKSWDTAIKSDFNMTPSYRVCEQWLRRATDQGDNGSKRHEKNVARVSRT